MEQVMMHIVNTTDLPGSTSRQFQGFQFGDVNVSFFVSATPPGRGPLLHMHPYAEVFVVQDAGLTFVVGDQTIDAAAGQIIVVPAGTPHKLTNTGAAVAHHIDIHTSAKMETTWLEESGSA
jgi:mannose-6-phosphate isomerase-like protein (cupin superfamily)